MNWINLFLDIFIFSLGFSNLLCDIYSNMYYILIIFFKKN